MKDARFSFLGFLGKSNEDISIFNNHLFVSLIVMRFSGKKYNKIFSDFVHYFYVFWDFLWGYF